LKKGDISRILIPGWLTILIILSAGPPGKTHSKTKKLTFTQAYEDAESRPLEPLCQIPSWLDDHHYLLKEQEGSEILFKVNVSTGEKTLFLDYGKIQQKLPDGLKASEHADHTEDYSRLIYLFQDDLYLYESEKNELRRMTSSLGREKNPRFSPNRRCVAFTRQHNLYSLDIETGREYQLTSDGSSTVYNGWASWVYFEEILRRECEHAAFWWSPNSSKIAFLRFDDSSVPVFPVFSTEGPHGSLRLTRYPKAGDPNPFVMLGVVPATGGPVVWADTKEKADHYLAFPIWSPDGSMLTFQWMNRAQDNIKVYMMDISTGSKQEIYDEKQSSWVEFFPDLAFLKDGSGFLLRSDKDGWWHLYSYDVKGNLKHRITQGEWSVTGIILVDEKKQKISFHGRKGNTAETHLYQVNMDGTGLKRLTKKAGSHKGLVSPGGVYFIDEFSSINEPSRLDLFRSDGTFMKNICQSRTPSIGEYSLPKKVLFPLLTEDDFRLPAYWILPPDFNESKKYPVLFLVYGGPTYDDDTVSDSYPPLSELYLAQEGIIVFRVDHRGSGHFGKRGASLMHRNLGKWEMHDLIAAVKWLYEKPFVDRTKIGITGRSYGGYTTCMALTYGSDYFTHGYARFPVTDWKLYDSVYTERYMDRPCENGEGYDFGSVLSHAHRLKGILHLAHGELDDNVHVQNTVQLISRLMDLGKIFTFMLYPDQTHHTEGKKKIHLFRHYIDFWFKHFLGGQNE
jgi:dipeptidyl-peptidase-4